ncbi:MAG: helix-turn-helix domain-containing protein [Bacteroidales bacterium]|nr:helix-turn-helix domain-containing protein [Bacteroidales bacterium]
MKPRTAIVVFAIIFLSSFLTGIHGYCLAQEKVRADLFQALQRTLATKYEAWITPDTIRTYRSHLALPQLRDKASISYDLHNDRRESLSSRSLTCLYNGKSVTFKAYANCSAATLLAISDQRLSLGLLLFSLAWAIGSYWFIRKKHPMPSGQLIRIGRLVYSATDGRFYDHQGQAIHLTPMQDQLMRMFMDNETHTLSQQVICDTLWPKKEDASETLYTLIRRLKIAVEDRFRLRIMVDRGRSYTLTEDR